MNWDLFLEFPGCEQRHWQIRFHSADTKMCELEGEVREMEGCGDKENAPWWVGNDLVCVDVWRSYGSRTAGGRQWSHCTGRGNLLVDFIIGLASTVVRALVQPPVTRHLIIEPCPKSHMRWKGQPHRLLCDSNHGDLAVDGTDILEERAGLFLGFLKTVVVCLSPSDTLSHTHMFNGSCQKQPWSLPWVESRGSWGCGLQERTGGDGGKDVSPWYWGEEMAYTEAKMVQS